MAGAVVQANITAQELVGRVCCDSRALTDSKAVCTQNPHFHHRPMLHLEDVTLAKLPTADYQARISQDCVHTFTNEV